MSLVRNLLKATLEQDGALVELPLDQIETGVQPRRHFDEKALEDLARSIRTHGVLEPVIVTPKGDGRYLLVAGERRVRAARLAGLDEIPALIRDLSPEEARIVALYENLLREDLSLYETAHWVLELLSSATGWSRDEAEEKLRRLRRARDRKRLKEDDPDLQALEAVFEPLPFNWYTFTTYHLRAMRLPGDLRQALEEGAISYPFARILARVKDEEKRRELLRWVVEARPTRDELRRRVSEAKASPAPGVQVSVRELSRAIRRLPPEKRAEAERVLKEALERIRALSEAGG